MSLATVTGYGARKATPYHPSASFPPGSLSGKVFAITGGHAGIGLATTKFLALGGARVIICSRTESKVREAIEDLVKQHSEVQGLKERLSYVKLDLNSLHQVEKSVEELLEQEQRLDGIVCNAGKLSCFSLLSSAAIKADRIGCRTGIMAFPYEFTEVSSRTSSAKAETHWKLIPFLLAGRHRTTIPSQPPRSLPLRHQASSSSREDLRREFTFCLFFLISCFI